MCVYVRLCASVCVCVRLSGGCFPAQLPLLQNAPSDTLCGKVLMPSSFFCCAVFGQAWAYKEDQKMTTHPVNPESVVDTDGTHRPPSLPLPHTPSACSHCVALTLHACTLPFRVQLRPPTSMA